ncbi:Zinc finger and SCAN domain-containing protein 29 [Chelonia mydas]|uniref:Zinc finger and SCAN domain-containing protein 29 n=1 Tax=Chelonia mydas TaxID=8469 RepID=M7BTX6_CHEMY|nr:Zinc finger and SCAN domain-containing protein 29 [Chelonia mydas]
MESQNRKRAPAWTERQVLDLIAVWGDESVLSELRSKRRNAKIFEKISKGMNDRGYHRDLQQCCVKLKELRQAYQKTQEANPRSGSEPQTCSFYDELHAILGGAPTTTPHLYVDSCQGVSHNRDEDFGDEEDDEEGEVEDSAHQASRETILPDSQELFITLEPIPSQPSQDGLPDLEGGEGTSASCCGCHLAPRIIAVALRSSASLRRENRPPANSKIIAVALRSSASLLSRQFSRFQLALSSPKAGYQGNADHTAPLQSKPSHATRHVWQERRNHIKAPRFFLKGHGEHSASD